MEETNKIKYLLLIAIIIVVGLIAIKQIKIVDNYNKNANVSENNYETYIKNIKTSISSLNNDENQTAERRISIKETDKGSVYGILGAIIDENDDAYILLKENSELYQKYGEKYKVDSNVSSLYNVNNGNGGFSDIVFIKNDGTVSRVSTSIKNNEINCEVLSDVKNAVTVIPYLLKDKSSGVGEYRYVIIDINGNKFKI